jgi:hypothetical protein
VQLPLEPGEQVQRVLVSAGQDPVTAVVTRRSSPTARSCTIFDTRTGDRLRQVALVGAGGYRFTDLSPNGKHLVGLTTVPGPGPPTTPVRVTVWDTTSGSPVVRDWEPPPQESWKKRLAGNGITWAGFVGDDRLITLTEHGGLDVWSFPARTRTGGFEGDERAVGAVRYALPDRMFNVPAPRTLALSPDRKTLAKFNGEGFTLYDTAIGEERLKTVRLPGPTGPYPFPAGPPGFPGGPPPGFPGGPPPGFPGGPFPQQSTPLLLGFAFDPPGETLAVAYLSGRSPQATLAVLDARTGQQKAAHGFLFPAAPMPTCELFWWGNRVVASPTPVSGVVLDPASGRVVTNLAPRPGGELLRDTGDGGSLWGHGKLVPNGPTVVYALAFPEAFPAAGKSPGRVAATPNGFMEPPPPEKKEPAKKDATKPGK